MLDALARRAEGAFPIQCPITFTKRVLGGLRRFVDHHPLLAVTSFAGGVVMVAMAMVVLALRALH